MAWAFKAASEMGSLIFTDDEAHDVSMVDGLRKHSDNVLYGEMHSNSKCNLILWKFSCNKKITRKTLQKQKTTSGNKWTSIVSP